jgi:hypothetical protein
VEDVVEVEVLLEEVPEEVSEAAVVRQHSSVHRLGHA